MSDAREMGEMLACAPVGREEALVPVLCVEATARTQEAVEGALRAMAATATDGGAASCARAALCKLPGTRLRVSPHTTVHVLRGFLQSEVAGAADSVATAQFFAVRVPAAAAGGAARAAEVRVGGTGANADADADAEESVVALNPDMTLQELLSCGTALRLELADDELEPTLVLLYSRESFYGDMVDACIFGFCAAIGGWIAHMCIREATKTVNEHKKNQKAKKAQKQQEQQQQQQQQQQYYQPQQQQQQPGPNGAYGGPPPPPPPENYQPYYQGPNSYGAPPQQQSYSPGPPGAAPYQPTPSFPQQQQQQQQQQPASGYPISPSGPYSYNAAPPQAKSAPCVPPAPPQQRSPPPPAAAAACSAADVPPSPHQSSDLPPAQYPSVLHAEDHEEGKEDAGAFITFKADTGKGSEAAKLKGPIGKENGAAEFGNSSSPPPTPHQEAVTSGPARFVTAQPQYGALRANEDAPAWSWSPINTTAEEAIWSPASGQADGADGTSKEK